MAITRVCIYTRISTDEENQPTSLHSQRERLEAFCKVQDGWRIVANEEDRSTGTKLDRPGLERALELAREHPIDLDRKSTRLNSSHGSISYAVFCLKKK